MKTRDPIAAAVVPVKTLTEVKSSEAQDEHALINRLDRALHRIRSHRDYLREGMQIQVETELRPKSASEAQSKNERAHDESVTARLSFRILAEMIDEQISSLKQRA